MFIRRSQKKFSKTLYTKDSKTIIFDGLRLAEEVMIDNRKAYNKYLKLDPRSQIPRPKLGIVNIGDEYDNELFTQRKRIFLHRYGFECTQWSLTKSAQKNKVIELIERMNQDDSIHGILVN